MPLITLVLSFSSPCWCMELISEQSSLLSYSHMLFELLRPSVDIRSSFTQHTLSRIISQLSRTIFCHLYRFSSVISNDPYLWECILQICKSGGHDLLNLFDHLFIKEMKHCCYFSCYCWLFASLLLEDSVDRLLYQLFLDLLNKL